MYVREGINPRHIFRDSWAVIVVSALWASLVVVLYEILGARFIGIPIAPVTTVGIVVSLYLGFKSNSAYNRWWEARKIWGSIVNDSRVWANHSLTLVTADREAQRTLIYRHLAWVNALAFQLRKNSRLKPAAKQHIFDRRLEDISAFDTATRECYRRYLSPEEAEDLTRYANPAVHIIRKQGAHLQALLREGALDNNRIVQMAEVLGRFYDSQGACERIKNAPFPRQITHFGLIFTYLFMAMMPLALVDTFARTVVGREWTIVTAHEYMFTMVPFSVLISWLFFIVEKVSESCEDPFEWGTTDVPISALTRTIEIDLLQMLDEPNVPQQLQPVNGVLY
ncbi:bestrophin family protein [Acuticoccus kandeliae]|uniref:bestrophin family protein n=1 Tax=Acuticoccus kandeliae TaxID=2073160 RepID=UPI000D3E485B|nr:bestrophin family ion channel [Acuticoccus kandeliae]